MTDEPKVVVVTGAAAGVGRATAIAFARRGDRVALLARSREGLEGAAAEVRAAGGEALVIPCDVAAPEQVEAAAEAVEAAFGPIDVWVNDAMVSVFAPFKTVTAEEFRRVTEVTYLGFVHGTMAALKRMLPRDRGVIIQVGSALSYRSIPLQSAYCGAKHGMVGFTDSLRSELLHDRSRVRVTVVHLPAVNTPQFRWVRTRLARDPQPVPPIYQPEVPAEAIVWASEHVRREVWVGFPTWKAIVGQRLFPGLLDRYLALTGYQGQMTDRPASAARLRTDNLFAPVDGLHSTHGDFDDRAREGSLQLWVTTHRGTVALGVLGVAGLAAGAAALVGRRRAARRAGVGGLVGAVAGTLMGSALATGRRSVARLPRPGRQVELPPPLRTAAKGLRVAFLRSDGEVPRRLRTAVSGLRDLASHLPGR